MTSRFDLPPGVLGGAVFSPDRRFRYWLERRWDGTLPQFTFVLLNPSAAGGDRDDMTNRRLHTLTVSNGGGGYELVNLFAVVDTHQEGLHYPEAIDETPGANDGWIAEAVQRSETVVLGWGDGSGKGVGGSARRAGIRKRAREVWPLVRDHRPTCFVVIDSGAPGHPGRLHASTPCTAYSPSPDYL